MVKDILNEFINNSSKCLSKNSQSNLLSCPTDCLQNFHRSSFKYSNANSSRSYFRNYARTNAKLFRKLLQQFLREFLLKFIRDFPEDYLYKSLSKFFQLFLKRVLQELVRQVELLEAVLKKVHPLSIWDNSAKAVIFFTSVRIRAMLDALYEFSTQHFMAPSLPQQKLLEEFQNKFLHDSHGEFLGIIIIWRNNKSEKILRGITKESL